jgi:hypothetical protein
MRYVPVASASYVERHLFDRSIGVDDQCSHIVLGSVLEGAADETVGCRLRCRFGQGRALITAGSKVLNRPSVHKRNLSPGLNDTPA